jgi:uncharacterized protein (TIGR04255 family)
VLTSSPLPDFERPPVVEVALSLQFKPLELLRSSHLGMLWGVFRNSGYLRTEDHGELEPAFEDFGDAKVTTRVGVRMQTFNDAPPLARVWFLNEAQNELLQFQRDRFIVNWRRGAEAEPYPRYESISGRFRREFAKVVEFLEAERLGEIVPTQCELTYVNHIPAGQGWTGLGQADHVVTVWKNEYSDSYLSTTEDEAFAMRYRMTNDSGKPAGRLHITFHPAVRATDGMSIFAINLTARGEPKPADLQGSLRLFDMEHEWIVRGFASVTTPRMHEIWGRRA